MSIFSKPFPGPSLLDETLQVRSTWRPTNEISHYRLSQEWSFWKHGSCEKKAKIKKMITTWWGFLSNKKVHFEFSSTNHESSLRFIDLRYRVRHPELLRYEWWPDRLQTLLEIYWPIEPEANLCAVPAITKLSVQPQVEWSQWSLSKSFISPRLLMKTCLSKEK